MGEAMSDEIRAEIKAAATALCHYPLGPNAANSCCSGIGRCEMKAAVAEITRLRAELAIRALSDTPPGMVLVPREPTPEMIHAGFLVGPQVFKNRRTADWWPSDVTAIYHAMVRAAEKGEGND
jgi:hypothetical protein